MKIHRATNKAEVKKHAAEALNALLQDYKEKPILLMVSAGSAMGLLDFVDTESLGKNVTITVLDERFSVDPKVNNFAQFTQTKFYEKIKERGGANILDTRPQDSETLEKFAKRFESFLLDWSKEYREGKVIITQGIGADGHTAGIMPYPENPELFKKLFEDPKLWVVGYDASEKNPYPLRVTVTLTFLREKVDHSLVYVVGENKREVLKRVLAKEGSLWETPVRIIHEMKEVKIFTNITN